jgi:hypothetical protein
MNHKLDTEQTESQQTDTALSGSRHRSDHNKPDHNKREQNRRESRNSEHDQSDRERVHASDQAPQHKHRGGKNNNRNRQNFRPSGRGGYNHHQAQDGGNRKERIAIESGHLVFIDQFMLANELFIDEYEKIIDEETDVKTKLIEKFGGKVVSLTPGTYRIERDPYKTLLVVHPEGEVVKTVDLKDGDYASYGTVFVDTRCIAMVDRELLDDSGLLEKYKQLWNNGQDKACRDLLRDNGGAVRYGFSRDSEDLNIYKLSKDDTIALWP